MKGILKKRDGRFVVEYETEVKISVFGRGQTTKYQIRELPLHPADAVTNPPIRGEIQHILVTGESLEVNFEMVNELKENKFWGQKGTGVYISYAKLIDSKHDDVFKNIKESITNSTKKSGYSAYIPDDAKKEETTPAMKPLENKFKVGFDKDHPHKPWESLANISADVAIKFGQYIADKQSTVSWFTYDSRTGKWFYYLVGHLTTEELFNKFLEESYD